MRYIRGLTAATVVVLLESDMCRLASCVRSHSSSRCSAQLRLNLLALTSVQFSAAAIVEYHYCARHCARRQATEDVAQDSMVT